jgi:hypothetical protein
VGVGVEGGMNAIGRSESDMIRAFLVTVLIVVAAAGPTLGQDAPPPPNETLAGIPAISVWVDTLAANVADKGITAGVLGAEVVGRLKSAGIEVLNLDATQPVAGAPTLYLVVITLMEEGVDQVVYSIRLSLTQAVRLDRDPNVLVPLAPTWSVSGVGVAMSGWRDAMIADVVNYTDQFIDAYFRANPDRAGD